MLEQKYLTGDTAVKIAESVQSAVSLGHLAPGALLPTVRRAAAGLGVAPATVAAAYRLLRDRGVVVAEGRRGTRIRQAPPVSPVRAPRIPSGARDLAAGNPDPELLPDFQKALAKIRLDIRVYGEELNDRDLLELAAKSLPDPRHLAIVSGALDGIERVLREHLRPGDRVVVEDPCFTGISDLLAVLALTPVPVAIDDEGFVPDAMRDALRRSPAALIVTPRAQNPTGAAITPRRQRMLRAILKLHPNVLVIEDDHAGPVAGADYSTLVDSTTQRWAVVRSVSKSLGPDLRLAVMSGDAATIAGVEGRQTLGIRWVSHILQRLVLALWRDRAVSRLVDRAARTYAERRAALIDALRGHGIAAHGASGLNVWIPVPEENAVVQGLREHGWAVAAGERYRIRTGPAIRVTIAQLLPAEAKRFANDLAAILSPRGRTAVS